jgi:cyclophilin family peptidyl-prolyl cis-trans isomerase
MFKENKEFWFYAVGTIVLMLLLYFVIISYQFPFVGFLTGKKQAEEISFDNAPSMALQSGKDYRAKVYTNEGVIEIDLYEENAPVTVNNFVFLTKKRYYDGVKFHRVVKDFLIQTGSRNTITNNDPNDDALGDPGYTFADEINWDSLGLSAAKKAELKAAGYSNDTSVKSRRLEKYSVAMANAGPDTNGSQFFIVTADNNDSRLDTLQGRHTVFGTVVSGFDVLQKINDAPVEKASDDSISRPTSDYEIIKIEIIVK